MSRTRLPPPPVFKTTIIQMKGTETKNFTINNNDTSSSSNILTISSSSPKPMIIDSNTTTTSIKSTTTTTTTRKRRRSSQLSMDSTELNKKRQELKIAHSIIEKKRRIKMNREFEALKYLIPACRTHILNSSSSSSSSITDFNHSQISRRNSTTTTTTSDINSGENLNQMHKLTILQSTVEYIFYLHHIIDLQKNEIIKNLDPNWDNLNELNFTQFEIDLNQVRDIDKEFDFDKLFKNLILNNNNNNNNNQQQPVVEKSEMGKITNKKLNLFQYNNEVTTTKSRDVMTKSNDGSVSNIAYDDDDDDEISIDDYLKDMNQSSSSSSSSSSSITKNIQLPSPVITPEIIGTNTEPILNNYYMNGKVSSSFESPQSPPNQRQRQRHEHEHEHERQGRKQQGQEEDKEEQKSSRYTSDGKISEFQLPKPMISTLKIPLKNNLINPLMEPKIDQHISQQRYESMTGASHKSYELGNDHNNGAIIPEPLEKELSRVLMGIKGSYRSGKSSISSLLN